MERSYFNKEKERAISQINFTVISTGSANRRRSGEIYYGKII
jgi:hypothetical protein